MHNWKKALKKVFSPPIWVSSVFIVLSFAFLAFIMVTHTKGPLAYAAYLASAFGLYYLVNCAVVPLVKKVIRLLLTGKYTSRYFKDNEFSLRLGLYTGTAFNTIYALFKLISGVIYRSEWFVSIAFYYILLSCIRFTIIKNDIAVRRKRLENLQCLEWKSYRNVGWLMLLINVVLSGMIVQIIVKDKSYSYQGVIIFISALYVFYRVGVTVRGLLKNRSGRNPIASSSRIIDFCIAIVSLFTLQTAMLASFSKTPEYNHRINIATGTAVVLTVTVTSVFMIIKGIVNIRKIRRSTEKQ